MHYANVNLSFYIQLIVGGKWTYRNSRKNYWLHRRHTLGGKIKISYCKLNYSKNQQRLLWQPIGQVTFPDLYESMCTWIPENVSQRSWGSNIF